MTLFIKRILGSEKGQSLIELSLIAPIMVLLAYGAVEVGSVISTYITLTHTTREAANLTSRGTPYDQAMTAVISAAAPTLTQTNKAQWKLLYTRIIQDPAIPCPPEPCTYIIAQQTSDGNLVKFSKVGVGVGTPVTLLNLPGIQSVGPGQTFHSYEIFYDYAPSIITYVGKAINTDFYDRTIFTHVAN